MHCLYLTGLIKLAYMQVFVYTNSYTDSKTTFSKLKLWSGRFTKYKEKNIWTQKGLKIVCHWNLHDCKKKYRFTWIIHKYIHINILKNFCSYFIYIHINIYLFYTWNLGYVLVSDYFLKAFNVWFHIPKQFLEISFSIFSKLFFFLLS